MHFLAFTAATTPNTLMRSFQTSTLHQQGQPSLNFSHTASKPDNLCTTVPTRRCQPNCAQQHKAQNKMRTTQGATRHTVRVCGFGDTCTAPGVHQHDSCTCQRGTQLFWLINPLQTSNHRSPAVSRPHHSAAQRRAGQRSALHPGICVVFRCAGACDVHVTSVAKGSNGGCHHGS